jgi:hypothetical protein
MKFRYNVYKIILLSVLCFLFPSVTFSQTYDEITSRSDIYIFGEGIGNSAKVADRNALAEVSEQIVVSIKSDFNIEDVKVINGDEEVRNSMLKSMVSTYSQSTLTSCSKLVLENGPQTYRILRYIRKTEVDRVFKAREDKIKEMVRVAEAAERELKLDVALKYYYWATLLTKTLVRPSELYYEDRQLTVWIPAHISEILDNITFTFGGYVSDDRTLGRLKAMYKGKNITSLDYTYWDGIGWSYLSGVKDGLGSLEFRADVSVSSINVKIEYLYDNEVHVDNEISSASEVVSPINFPGAFKNGVKISGESTMNIHDEVYVDASIPDVDVSHTMSDVEDVSVYKEVIETVLGGFPETDYAKYFTDEGYKIFSKLLKYGRVKVLDEPELDYLDFDGKVFCRSIPMRFNFMTNDKVFVEDVVFVFDQNKKIESLNFSLEDITVQSIMSKSKWTDAAKMALISFLENYKTAFALNRLDYISSIFSDDALIITGRVVKRVDIENSMLGNNEYVIYNRQSKDEYISNLARSFASKEYINLKFSNISITKMMRGSNPNIYSIQIKQDYYSSNYGDTGYLFLLVDMNDYEKPIIHLRTWQPKPDKNISESGIFGPGNF